VSAAEVYSPEHVAYAHLLLRLDAILLGRMGLTPSQAINAYLKLEPSLSVGMAKDDQERKKNSDAFEAAFCEVLADAGIEADAPMVTTDTTKTRT
jgi:hypothetical protein